MWSIATSGDGAVANRHTPIRSMRDRADVILSVRGYVALY